MVHREALPVSLAEAAPDLLAALLMVEWVNDPSYHYICPWCGGEPFGIYENGKYIPKDRHELDCARQAALAKACGESAANSWTTTTSVSPEGHITVTIHGDFGQFLFAPYFALRCEMCGAPATPERPVQYVRDPFYWEVDRESHMRWLCGSCEEQRADDI